MFHNQLKVDENRIVRNNVCPAKKLFANDEKKTVLSDISNLHNGRRKTRPSKVKTADDVDEMDRNKPDYFSTYSKSIYSNMLEVEGNFICKVDYFIHQCEIDVDMRCVLIDWIVDVHYFFKLQLETLFLCVNYLDRFLERYVAKTDNLQLIGVGCLLIASKYEEIYYPKIKNFITLTGNNCTNKSVIDMERTISETIDYSFTGPTIYQFVSRCLKLCDESLQFQCVTYYLCERSLMEFKLSSIRPSKVSSACIVLASKYYHGKYEWPSILEDQFSYTIDDLMPIVKTLEHSLINADKNLQAIWRKYTRTDLKKACYIVHEEIGDSHTYVQIASR